MAEKENLVLPDPGVKPDEKLIFSYLGEKKVFWKELMEHMQSVYPDSSGDWNYYKDGKQWLFKMVLKKKTIFWSALLEDSFRITFYFGDKAAPIIEESSLPQKIKEDFKVSKRYGAIRGISLKISDKADIETVKVLCEIKARLK